MTGHGGTHAADRKLTWDVAEHTLPTRMAGNGQGTAGNGRGMAGNGREWLEMAGNGREWSGNGREWPEMA